MNRIASTVEDLGGFVTATYDKALDGLAVTMTPEEAAELSRTEGVAYVEPDRIVRVGTALISDSGCTATTMPQGDDLSSPLVSLGFDVNWFQTQYSQIYVNTNGGIAFNDGNGPFTNYTFNLDTISRPVILVAGTDLDSTSAGTVSYGPLSTGDGFCITWSGVGVYPATAAKVTAQLVIYKKSGGAVDLLMNYVTLDSSMTRSIDIGYAAPAAGQRLRVSGSGTAPSPFRDGQAGTARSSQRLDLAGYPSVAGRFGYAISGVAPTATASPSATPTPSASSACPDSVPAGTQGCATWGLDRVDQRALPLDTRFTPAGSGSGVTTYIIDTGVLGAHTEFTGRYAGGYDYVSGDSDPTDCNGHGTHVAGTVAGAIYGVAKSATVKGVRVLDCSGSGYTSWVISGINWAISDHVSGPAVLNMSLGGGYSKSLNDAVAAAVADGITAVVAAGNSADDACGYSPASEATAITVGATSSTDAIAYFSNDGPCVDIFAPGVNITSAWYTSTTATTTISGTSMASPHVAGTAAVYLGMNPTATPAQVTSALQSAGTASVVTGASAANNRLLYARSFEAASSSPSPSASSGGSVSGGGSSSGGGGGGSSGGGSSGGGGALQAITEVRPAVGPLSGGNQVSIIGYGFTGATRVEIGGKSVAFTVMNDAHVQVTMPPGDKVGSADVAVVLTPARGRAFAPGGYVYQESVSVPVAPTQPGQVGILTPAASTSTASTSLPSSLAITGRVSYTQSATGVRTVRVTVPRTAAGRTASLLRKGKVVAKATVRPTGVVTFRGRTLTPGAYRMSISDGRATTVVTTPIVLRTPTRSR